MRATGPAATSLTVAGLTCRTRDPALERWLATLADRAPTQAGKTLDQQVAYWERDRGSCWDLAPGATPCWSFRSVTGFVRDDRPVFCVPGGAVWLADPAHARVFGEPQAAESVWQDLLLASVFELAAAAGAVALHAAVLEWRACGLLVAAPSGAGKSTFTYCSAIAGACYSGDDVAVVRPRGPGWRARGFGVGIRVYPETRVADDPFVPYVARDGDGKVSLAPVPDRVCRADEIAIRRLVFLCPGHGEISFWRICDPAEVLPRLLGHVALALTPTVAARQLEQVGRLARLPAGELRTGRELLASPAEHTSAVLDRVCHE